MAIVNLEPQVRHFECCFEVTLSVRSRVFKGLDCKILEHLTANARNRLAAGQPFTTSREGGKFGRSGEKRDTW